MNATGRPTGNPPPHTLAIAAAFVVLFAAEALFFAAYQDLWTDESTQLAGIRMGVGDLLRWLAGTPYPTGVPADRMPPLGYLVDMACARTICTTVFGLRVLHLAITAVGVGVLLDMIRRLYGFTALLVAGLFLLLSASLVDMASELRAYPLFFACACVQVRLFCAMFDVVGATRGRLALFAGVAIATSYVHFFGIVCSSALFVGLAAGRARSVRDVIAIGLAWGVVLVAAMGLVPFIMGANMQADAVPNGVRAADIVPFLLRIAGFSSLLVRPWMGIAFFFGLAVVLAVAAWRTLPRSRRALVGPWPAGWGLVVALVAGLTVTVVSALVIHGFSPMKATYSIWTMPVVATLVGMACGDGFARASRLRLVALAGAAAMLVGAAGGQAMLLGHPRWFTHGVVREIEAQFVTSPDRIAIVYEGEYWPAVHFPFSYLYGPRLRQWRIDDAGAMRRLRFGLSKVTPIDPGPGAAAPPVEQVILASVHPETYRELRGIERGIVPADLLRPLDPSPSWLGPDWHAGNEIRIPGNYWLRLISFHRSAGR